MKAIGRTAWVLATVAAGLGAGFVGHRVARIGSPVPDAVPVPNVAALSQKEPAGWVEFVREAKAGQVALESPRFVSLIATAERIEDAYTRIEDNKLRESAGKVSTKWGLVRIWSESSRDELVSRQAGFDKIESLRKELAPLLAEIVQKRP